MAETASDNHPRKSMTRLYLNLNAGGLALVALGYALIPHTALGSLLSLPLDNVDQVHILRAIMGLYLGLVGFWFFSASRPAYSRTAVVSVVFFMLGLALGRTISIVIDGVPSPLLFGATLVEYGAGGWGMFILRKP
jgi:hypothetical protein